MKDDAFDLLETQQKKCLKSECETDFFYTEKAINHFCSDVAYKSINPL